MGPRGHAQSRRQPRDMSSGQFVQGTCPVAPLCRTGHAHPHTPARDMSSLRPNQRATCSLLSAISGQNGILPTDHGCGRACPVVMMRCEEHALSCTSSRHMSGPGCGWTCPVAMMRCEEHALSCTSSRHMSGPGCGWTCPVAMMRCEEHALSCTSSRHMSGPGCGWTCPVVMMRCEEHALSCTSPLSMFRLGPALRGTCSLLNAISGQNGILPTDRDCG